MTQARILSLNLSFPTIVCEAQSGTLSVKVVAYPLHFSPLLPPILLFEVKSGVFNAPTCLPYAIKRPGM